MSNPSAALSKVPVCPILIGFLCFLIFKTRSEEVIPAGFEIRKNPELIL